MVKVQRPTTNDIKRLDEIYDLIERREADDALQRAKELAQKRPRLVDAWDVTLHAATLADSDFDAWYAVRQLLTLEPDEPLHVYNMAIGSSKLGAALMCEKYVKQYLRDYPDGNNVKDMRQMDESLTPIWEEIREDLDFPHDVSVDVLEQFEAGRILIMNHVSAEGRKLSQEAAKYVNFAGPSNNIALSYALECKLGKALDVAQKTLEKYPDNYHAQANLAQFLARLGRRDEAMPIIEALSERTPKNIDDWSKLIETCAFADADQVLYTVYQKIAKHNADKGHMLGVTPMTHHYAAVAAYRLGHEKIARGLWKMLLREDPSLQIARNNLKDIDKPIHEQNGAWYFDAQYRINKEWLQRIEKASRRSIHKSDEQFQRIIAKICDAIEGLKPALEAMLLSGSPQAIDIALGIIRMYPIDALLTFVTGQHGSDADRMRGLQIATELGLIGADEPITLYLRGEYQEIYNLNFEIYDEPREDDMVLPDNVQDLYDDAYAALQRRQPDKAMSLINEGIELAPEYPSFRNLKWTALQLKSQTEEADAVIRQTYEEFPDYFFARAEYARLLVREDKLDEALEILNALMRESKFHVSEFRVLALAFLDLYEAREDDDAIHQWETLLEQVDPDHYHQYKASKADSNKVFKQLQRMMRKTLDRHK